MERYALVLRVDTKYIYLRGDKGELIQATKFKSLEITMAHIYTNPKHRKV